MEQGYDRAAINSLISGLLKYALTRYKKETETSVNPEEYPGVDDHGKSVLNFDR